MAFDFATKTARDWKTFQVSESFTRTPHAGHYMHPSYMSSQFEASDWDRQDEERGDHRIMRRGRSFWGEFSAMFPGVSWAVVEPTTGNYDFSTIRAWIQWCSEQQIFYGINFVSKNFDARDGDTIPADLVAIGGQVKSGNFASFNAAIWKTEVEAAFKNCLTAIVQTFGDNPWFVGLEFTETAGVDTSGQPIRYKSTSPYYETVPGTTNGYTDAGFARATGRLYEHMASLQSNILSIGSINKFQGGESANRTAFADCFSQVTVRDNIIVGGPDILYTDPGEHSDYLRDWAYGFYTDATLEFSQYGKKCAMQNTSQIVNLNIGKTIDDLWRWGVYTLHLKCVQWNYHDGEGPVTLAQGTGSYEHTWAETKALIAGTTPINWADYSAWATI